MKLYTFVMGNLSGRQQGIQAGHSALEYAHKMFHTEKFQEFFTNHKTFIVLDGGGSKEMELRTRELSFFGVDFALFREPDLNDSISAVSFLVDGSEGQDFLDYLSCFKLASN